MKKLVIFIVMCFAGVAANAQFATYHSSTAYEEAQHAPTQTLHGYVPTYNGWVRISIRVKETSQGILVVGYKEKDTSTYGGAFATYGNSSPWRRCQAWAEEVSVYSDGREIANNFDCKASISGVGTVYF